MNSTSDGIRIKCPKKIIHRHPNWLQLQGCVQAIYVAHAVIILRIVRYSHSNNRIKKRLRKSERFKRNQTQV